MPESTEKDSIWSASTTDLGHISSYDYELPDELIAAHPAERRDASRLMVADRADESIEHRHFSDIIDHLGDRDLLVFNDTRVVPARVMTHKKETGGFVELLVLDVVEPASWSKPADGSVVLRCMTRSSRPLRPGMRLVADTEDTPFDFVVRDYESGQATVTVDWTGPPTALLEKCGQMPLPPYIVKQRERLGDQPAATELDRRRYQTVYASEPGAVAAPTAGLHFTNDLLGRLDQAGVRRAYVTLQVGPGTFRPVSAERLAEHDMHSESYSVSSALGDAIERTRRDGGRIIAVGTTTARALEAEARRERPFEPGTRQTDLFLRPGVDFEVLDGLITNFHLPRSTLLALVSALAGYDFVRRIYEEAVGLEYRFYSYGDAMLIL